MSAAKRARTARNKARTSSAPAVPGYKPAGIAAEVFKNRLSPHDPLHAKCGQPHVQFFTELDFARMLTAMLQPGSFCWAPRKQAPTFEKGMLPSYGSAVGVTEAGKGAGAELVPKSLRTYLFPGLKQGGLSVVADFHDVGDDGTLRGQLSCFHFPSGRDGAEKRLTAARFIGAEVSRAAASSDADFMLGFCDFNADVCASAADREAMFAELESAGFRVFCPPGYTNAQLRNDFKRRLRRRQGDPPEGIVETVSKFGDAFFKILNGGKIAGARLVRWLLPPAKFPEAIGAADWFSDHKYQYCAVEFQLHGGGGAQSTKHISFGGHNILAARMSDEIRAEGGRIAPFLGGGISDDVALAQVGTTKEFTYDVAGQGDERTWPFMVCPFVLDPTVTRAQVHQLCDEARSKELEVYADVCKVTPAEAKAQFVDRPVWAAAAAAAASAEK